MNTIRTDEEETSLRRGDFQTAVINERAYQDRKWGGSPHDRQHTLPEWLLILEEEVGEVALEVGNIYWHGDEAQQLRIELIQVAAVCAAMIEVVDATIKGQTP